jgi:hypothetical protein
VRIRVSLTALAGVLAALTVGTLGAPPVGAAVGGRQSPSSPPMVSASNWSDAHAPAVSTTSTNELNAVSCTSESFCVAVGEQNVNSGGGSLIEQWNGTAWSIVPSVNPPGSLDEALDAVSCVGTSFCLAVGGNGVPLAEMWNGVSWSLVPVALPPPVVDVEASLTSVSCVSVSRCETLGTGSYVHVIENVVLFGNEWNGSVLSLTGAGLPTAPGSTEPSTNPHATGMDCVSAVWCIAVGNTDVGGASGAPFSELWNGTTWSLVTAPAPVTGAGGLQSVSCVGSSYCQAVGEILGGATSPQNLIETWNGSAWSIAAGIPDTSPALAQELTGVDCFSATTCSAVGWSDTTPGASPATLALVWNGTTWSIVPNSPNGGATPSTTQLAGVSCLTDWACVAVGRYEFSAGPPNVLVPFAMTAPVARSGYRFVASDGGIFAYGAAPFLGSTGGLHLNSPVVGMAVMPGGDGYDLVASDGGVFSYGSAQFYGSTGGVHLNAPVVGMALTADGAGYWLVASDGGIFSYGDAAFYGSTGSLVLNKPIVGMASTPDGKGYWLVASDGGIFSFGDAAFDGSTGSLKLNAPIVGMGVPTSGGYYLVGSDGGIFSYPVSNGPPFYGSTGSLKLNKPIVGMTTVQGGYYFAGSDGGIFAFPTTGGPPFLGSMGGTALNAPVVGLAS